MNDNDNDSLSTNNIFFIFQQASDCQTTVLNGLTFE